MRKIILLTFVLSILLLSSVSAYFEKIEINNDIKSNLNISESADKYPAIEIKDNLGLPLISSKVKEIILTEHTDICTLGECSSTLFINQLKKGKLFEDIEFYLIKGTDRIKTSISNYSIYLKKDYGNYSELIPYNYEEVEIGNYIVVIKGTKNINQNIDWVIVSDNKEIEELATWKGLENACYQETANASSLADGDCVLYYNGTYGLGYGNLIYPNTIDGDWATYATASGGSSFATIVVVNYTKPEGANSSSIWTMKHDSPAVEYQNLTLGDYGTCWDNYPDKVSLLLSFQQTTGAWRAYCYYSGGFQQIYGSGGGGGTYEEAMVWIGDIPQIQRINLTSPENDYISDNKSVTFNCSTLIPAVNLTLFIDDTANYTIYNSTEIQNLSLEISRDVSDGNHNWTCKMYNYTDGLFNASETRNFTIDTTAPIVNITYPFEDFDYLVKGENITVTWEIEDVSLNDSSCVWSMDEGITNHSVTCSDNETEINITSTNQNNFTLWAYDDVGNIGSDYSSWDYNVFDLLEYSYTQSVQEGSTNTFIANLTISNALSNAYINYNNTNYTSSVTSYGSNKYGFSKSIKVPFVDSNTNISFYYIINEINTTIKNQSIINVGISNCTGGYTYVLANYTLKDEETEEIINNTNSTIEIEIIVYDSSSDDIISQWNTKVNGEYNYAVCSNINLSTGDGRLYEQSRYYSDDYVAELHNMQNVNLNSTLLPLTINLLDLMQDDATEFLITYKSSQFLPIEDAIIDIQRKYISEGVYKTVEIPKTDSNGQAKANFDLSGVIYKATVSKDGELLGTFDNLAVVCENELSGQCEITLGQFGSVEDINNVDTDNDFVYSLTEDNRTITLSFSSPSGNAKNISMIVNSSSLLGNSTECNTETYSSSGAIICEVDDSLGDSFVGIDIYVDGVYLTGASTTILSDREQYFGMNHIVLTFILVLSIALMMISDPIALLIGVVLGLVGSALMLLTTNADLFGSASVLIYIVLTIILIIVKISNRN